MDPYKISVGKVASSVKRALVRETTLKEERRGQEWRMDYYEGTSKSSVPDDLIIFWNREWEGPVPGAANERAGGHLISADSVGIYIPQ